MRKEQLLNIYEDNGLYGAKDQNGQIVITAQYTEMYQFSCGLSLVRNSQYQYAYIDYDNNIVIPFGVYSWCEPRFVCGYARVLKDKWGIINTFSIRAYYFYFTLKHHSTFSSIEINDDSNKKGKKLASNYHKTSFWDYENEKMNDYDNWSDPFGDERAFYDGWSREDVESGLADAYE
jgi:hypothetical protein